ncbi:GDSL-type esterase/lipase family protein [Salinibius halmophilus]|uniref:GDSL-type esterase/lipase family protein n=1 Tax=Salinibius halmophilus TaxID=1853216 RepID=UPI0022780E2B|nr:GDSL-type esterase/lipase family protein [Salinibius halmophilus]
MYRDIRICFVGDSMVAGIGDEQALGWPGRLCAAANLAGEAISYYNLGVRRNTSADILARWQSECTPRLPKGSDNRIVFCCGVNDATFENGALRVEPEQSVANVKAMLTGAADYPTLFVGPPPIANAEQNERIAALSHAYEGVCNELGVPFIELFSPLVDDALIAQQAKAFDGSHPRQYGFEKMAKVIAESGKWWF